MFRALAQHGPATIGATGFAAGDTLLMRDGFSTFGTDAVSAASHCGLFLHGDSSRDDEFLSFEKRRRNLVSSRRDDTAEGLTADLHALGGECMVQPRGICESQRFKFVETQRDLLQFR